MTDDHNLANWLANRAGLKQGFEREVWIETCVQIIRTVRQESINEQSRLQCLAWAAGGIPTASKG